MHIVYVQSIFSAAIQNFGLKFSWYIFYASLNIGKNFVFLVICRITKVSSFDMYLAKFLPMLLLGHTHIAIGLTWNVLCKKIGSEIQMTEKSITLI